MSIEDKQTEILEGLKEQVRNTVKDSIDAVVEAKGKKKGYIKDEEDMSTDTGNDSSDNDSEDDEESDSLRESFDYSALVSIPLGIIGGGYFLKKVRDRAKRRVSATRLSGSSEGREILMKDSSLMSEVSDFESIIDVVDVLIEDDMIPALSSSDAQRIMQEEPKKLEFFYEMSSQLKDWVSSGERLIRHPRFNEWNNALPSASAETMIKGTVQDTLNKSKMLLRNAERNISTLERVGSSR